MSQLLGRDLTVTFWNDRVYIDFGWHHVEASMGSLEQALYAVLTVTPGIDRQTVQNTIEAYTYFFEHLSFASVVGAISEFGYADRGAEHHGEHCGVAALYLAHAEPDHAAHAGRFGQPRRHGHAGQRLRRRAGPDPQGGSYRNLDDFLALLPSW